jgi:antitoxin MazE
MKVQTKIQKWGNGLGLRVSGVLRDIPQLQAGAKVEVEVTQDGFIVKKTEETKHNLSLPYTEAQLLAGFSKQDNWDDLLVKPLPSESYD